MAAKKKTAEASAPTRSARAADVAPIEQPAAKVERNPSNDSVQTPGIDPELSSDNQHSSYKQSSEEFPPDQGNQMEEVPGKP
jgi:hypothetical protein